MVRDRSGGRKATSTGNGFFGMKWKWTKSLLNVSHLRWSVLLGVSKQSIGIKLVRQQFGHKPHGLKLSQGLQNRNSSPLGNPIPTIKNTHHITHIISYSFNFNLTITCAPLGPPPPHLLTVYHFDHGHVQCIHVRVSISVRLSFVCIAGKIYRFH